MEASILLVDDHPVFLKGLRSLLEDAKDMKVIGEAGDGQSALALIATLSPEVVVMDITMPGLSGIETTRRIVSNFPDTKVIALSIHSEKAFVVDMLNAGAMGYIVKESVPEELIKGIRCVISGTSYLSPDITGLVLSQFRNRTFPETVSPHGEIEVVRTKLEPAEIPEYHIPRPRLLKMLDKYKHLPLIMVAAPAGYGKSTLVGSWTPNIDWHKTWLSLDKRDNDLRHFLHYLAHAVKQCFPDALIQLCNAIESSVLPPIQVLAGRFINDATQIDEDILVVLDNFQYIKDKAINDFLSEVLRYSPRPIHWILISRSDPFLPLSKLRASGKLGEIRLHDLRFTLAEAKSYLEKLVQAPIDNQWVTHVTDKTEGWVTGLHLAALDLANKRNTDNLLSRLIQVPQYVMDYLFQEVFSSQSGPMKRSLMLTSILERFNTPVCEALFTPTGDKADEATMKASHFIDRIQKENLFIHSIENEREWYRFHHLFQQLLQKQLKRHEDPEKISAIHAHAFAWFRDNGFTNQAIHHAATAGNSAAAVRLIEENRRTALDADQWDQLKSWLEQLPGEESQKHPELLLARSWVQLLTSRVLEIAPLIRQVEFLTKQKTSESEMLAEINFFKGIIAYFQGNGESSLDHFSKASEQLSGSTFATLKSNIELWSCAALHLTGQQKTAIQRLKDGLGKIKANDGIMLSRLTFALSLIYMLKGQLPAAQKESKKLADICRENNLSYTGTWASYLKGNIAFQTLDIETAHRYFSRVIENQQMANERVVADAFAGLVLTCHFMGKSDQSDEILVRAQTYAKETKNPMIQEIIASCTVRLALLRGEVSQSAAWAGAVNESSAGPTVMFFIEIPAVTECRALISKGNDASLKEARKRLQALLKQFKNWHNTCQSMDIMVLKALVSHRLGNTPKAQSQLENAANLAMPNGWLRPFFEQDRAMAEILGRLSAEKLVGAHTGQALPSLRCQGVSRGLPKSETRTQITSVSPVPLPLVDPITNREMEILELLAQHLYNKEIAEKLFISPETVKTHLKRIYEKLMVANRRQAVSTAYELGLLKAKN